MGKRPPSPPQRTPVYRPGGSIDLFVSIDDLNAVFWPAVGYMGVQWKLVSDALKYGDRVLALQAIANTWKRHIDSFITHWKYPKTAYLAFKQYWQYYRLAIGLQERLLIEQILYDMGYPWNRLCTGFQPVGYRSDL